MSDDPTLAGILRGLASAPAVPLPPQLIGRFRVTRTLGSGGMGVVYEADDPTLGRKVAIKLLRADGDGSTAEAAASRLLREAQALAKISHPHVVTIYDAGRDGDRVYLAMELIVGATARAWRDAAPRTTAEILAVYRQAALGLAAAHDAGLVHRDVKPENLLVGDDGRVRVTDFGLVAAYEHCPGPGRSVADIDPTALTMTRTGAVMGTPPYMPPEAHRAQDVDARGDQWSLCVAIWEAVGGARPYEGTTYPELVDNVLAGRRVEPPARIPDRVRAALERGLDVDPARRWPSVTALSDAIAHRSRRGLAIAGAAVVLAAGLGAVALARHGEDRQAVVTPTDAAVVAVAVASTTEPFSHEGGCVGRPFVVDDATIGATVSHDAPSDIVGFPLAGGAPVILSGLPDQNFRGVRGDHDGEIAFFHRGVKPGPGTWITRVDRGGEPHIYEGPVDFNTSAGFAIVGDAVYYDAPEWRFLRRYREGVDDVQIAELPAGVAPTGITVTRDGRWLAIATSSPEGPCLVELAATPARVECLGTTSSGGVAFDRDGTALFHGDGTGVWRLDLATRRDDQVTTVPVYAGVAASADGRALIVSQCESRGRMIEVAADGTVTEAGRAALWDHALGPDGLVVAVRQDDDGTKVVEQDRDGTWRELVAAGFEPSGPALDRAGTRVVFASASEHGLFIAHTSPFAPDRLTDDASDSAPVFLADGRIAFTRYGADRQPHVWLVDPAGGAPVQTSDRVRVVLDVDRATDRILVLPADHRRLLFWDPATDRETQVPTGDVGEFSSGSVSPDGKSLVFRVNRTMTRMPLSPPGPPVALYENEAVSMERAIVTDAGAVRFSVWQGEGELVRVPLQ